MRLGLSLALLLAWNGVAAAAEDAREKQVREELERELEAEMAGMMKSSPPPSVEVFFDPTLDPKYELLEASFALDDNPMPYKIGTTGKQSIFFGILSPGQHTVTTTLVYRERPTSAFFNYTNLKYRLPGRYIFMAQRGLHMRMLMKVEANDALDAAKRLNLQASLEADMMVDAADHVSKKPDATAETEPEDTAAGASTAQANAKPDVTPASGKEPRGAGTPTTTGAVAATTPATGTPANGTGAIEATTPASGGAASTAANNSGQTTTTAPTPDAASPAVATTEKPKKKRVRRHMKNLLMNLAKGAKDDGEESGGADDRLKRLQKGLGGGAWQEVHDEVVDEDPAPLRPAAHSSNPESSGSSSGDSGSKPKRGKGSKKKKSSSK